MKKDILVCLLAILFLFPTCDWLLYPQSVELSYSNFPIRTERQFGLAVDSFAIEKAEVKANQNLSSILCDNGISMQRIDSVAKMSKEVFDVRKIRRGFPYTCFFSKDTTHQLQYLVYEPSPANYVKFSLSDSLNIEVKNIKVRTLVKSSSGVINTNLWNSMEDNNLQADIINQLSDIYAWTIDFFGLQKNDSYRMIYEEYWSDEASSTFVGYGKIRACWFNQEGREVYAFRFVQDSTESYFDQDGNSLHRQFLKAPLKFSRISSHFSSSRLHPILKIRRPHFGVDYAAPIGTPVLSIGDGEVVAACYSGGAGKMVKIKHNSYYMTGYLHLSNYAKGISVGSHVRQGDVIGYVGSSGLSTGAHLDFRFWKNGQPVDPAKIEAPPTEPVKEQNKNAFEALKQKYIAELNKLLNV